MKPVDAVGHLVFDSLVVTGYRAEEPVGELPKPDDAGPDGPDRSEPAVTVTVWTDVFSMRGIAEEWIMCRRLPLEIQSRSR